MDNVSNQEQDGMKPGRGRWRLVVVAAGLLLLLAACAVWFLHRHSASTAQQKPTVAPQVRAVLHLDSFVVNLADPEGDRFLRVGLELGLEREPDEHSKVGQSQMSLARTRDTILAVLTACDAQALMAPNGKSNLKDQLIKALREKSPELGVREVYFTDFLVQR